tara:strand:- start:59 stop:556 length:498 start_codon:yes stop_codon:yes gene_type:complete
MKELVTFRKYLNEGIINEESDISILDKKYNSQEEFDAGIDDVESILDNIINKVDHIENSPFNASSLIYNNSWAEDYDDYIEDEGPMDGWDIIRSSYDSEGLDIRSYYGRPGAGLGNDDWESKPDDSEWKENYPDKTYEEWWDLMNYVGDDAYDEVEKFLKANGKG